MICTIPHKRIQDTETSLNASPAEHHNIIVFHTTSNLDLLVIEISKEFQGTQLQQTF
jgi:hypothetical protein